MQKKLYEIYHELKELENLIENVAYNSTDTNNISIHIEKLRNWHLRVEQTNYILEEILDIDNEYSDYECPLCNGTDKFTNRIN